MWKLFVDIYFGEFLFLGNLIKENLTSCQQLKEFAALCYLSN